ncbi:MAG: hypothetical protein PHC61_05315 [Chitinivibrionales bacterium]|nr:hypothetical protein [Chitinivibrionales bacterium]
MRAVRTCVVAATVCLCVGLSAAQIVSFETPSAWLTLRQDSLIVKAQFDTARLQKKQVKLVITKVNDGKKKTLATKTVAVKDYFQLLNCGVTGGSIIGGKEFIAIDWSVADLKESGTVAPVGLLVLPKSDSANMLHAKKLAATADANAVLAQAKTDVARFVKAAGGSFMPFWNEHDLFLVCKKAAANNQLQFAFDGKNGKNAFLSFPDRILTVSLKTDSLAGRYYVRAYKKDTVSYSEQKWNNDIKQNADSNFICITMPWYDLSIIPTGGRIFGLAAFYANDKGKVLGALPAKADAFIPGTWGSLVLDK